MSFLFPDQPTPPNPLVTAAAQTGTNVSTGVANAFLNNVNQNTPSGSLRYDVTGNYGWTDPATGSTYQIPTFTSTQSLSPQQQAIQSQTDAAKMNMAGMANSLSGNVANELSTPFSTAGAPAAGNPYGISSLPAAATSFNAGNPVQTSLGNYGQQQSTFGDAGNITGSYGPGSEGLTGFTQQVQQALMGQINPQLDIQKNQLQQQLADQGIRYGSEAYNNAMLPFGQQQNQAWMGAITGATGQAKTLMDMAAQQAGFQNAAQQQAYTQAQGRGQFANEAQMQNYAQALGAGSFANQAIGQQFGQNAQMATFGNAGLAQQQAQQQAAFNAAQTARNQYMQEQYAQRNQPINEISSLMSGSQVSQPNWLNAPQSQIPTTDVGGLINQNFAQQQQNYQQQSANYNNLIGGVLGLGAGYLKSDRRAKENITKMGSVWTTDVDHDETPKTRLPIYAYSYKDDPSATQHVGPMAQDVEQSDRGAVTTIGGTKYIKPDRVMGNILRAG
jgi:hypothetical protein